MTWNIQQKALIEEFIGIGRDVVSRKLTLASGGNLSVRDPGNPEQFIVTATETWFDKLVLEDFSLIDFEGKVIQGAMHPSSEWRVHARTYQARPEVQSEIGRAHV
jgi:L-fuculose-phosphate aldolase